MTYYNRSNCYMPQFDPSPSYVIFRAKVEKLAIFKMYLLVGYWSGNDAKFGLWIYRYVSTAARSLFWFKSPFSHKVPLSCVKWHLRSTYDFDFLHYINTLTYLPACHFGLQCHFLLNWMFHSCSLQVMASRSRLFNLFLRFGLSKLVRVFCWFCITRPVQLDGGLAVTSFWLIDKQWIQQRLPVTTVSLK